MSLEHRNRLVIFRYKPMQLYKHQQDILNDDPKKCGLFLGTGSGKSLIALSLAQGSTLVICPKTLRDDKTWERNLEKLPTSKVTQLKVISKEDLKSQWSTLYGFETIIMDEVHTLCGVSPTIAWKNKKPYPKSSKLYETCLEVLSLFKPTRLYLLTATPIRNPMAVYALGRLLGRDWDFYAFRNTYYVPVRMNNREIWMPKKDSQTQERLGATVRKLGYTGQLSDWVDVPEQTHVVKNIPLSKEQEQRIKDVATEWPDPLVLVGKRHQVEQGVLKGNEFEESQVFPTGKLEAIEDLYEEFGKVLVFAKYKEQIQQIHDYFRARLDGTVIFTLTGDTENRGQLLESADKNYNKIIVVCQSSISAGYELPSFRCTIYASQSYSYVDLAQSWGRTLRINNLQKNLYVYLLSGEIDKAVYKALENKGDFQEATYAKII